MVGSPSTSKTDLKGTVGEDMTSQEQKKKDLIEAVKAKKTVR